MNKSMFSLILFCFFLSGCLSHQQSRHQFAMNNRLKTDIALTSVRVMVDGEEVPFEGSPEEELLSKAESKGMDKIFKKWLNSGFIFQTKDCPAPKRSQGNVIIREDQFSAQFDKMTNSYSSRFRIESEFRSCRHLSGRIIRLSEGKSITGQHQEVTLRFNDLFPEARGGYFLVARLDSTEDVKLLRLIGGGRILDVSGRLARGTIKKVRREIKAGDVVYLVRTSLEPIEAEEKAAQLPQKTPLPDVDEVVVKPREEPREKDMPAEPK